MTEICNDRKVRCLFSADSDWSSASDSDRAASGTSTPSRRPPPHFAQIMQDQYMEHAIEESRKVYVSNTSIRLLRVCVCLFFISSSKK